ncbi:MAG: hypothetical protein K8S13_23200 [Desulfobacula sp.]|uniref:hypothetical protein n=1 Tax=Desulfobacula sp. TaxID=2593537 RepID=UPI0025C31154|nr:hypothetical protein [Desulfobacula sp.]MCD4722737.1 hypothetical protein [Desulfobacula sp.]
MAVETGSFRDPSGQVFIYNKKIYRCIYQPGLKDYHLASEKSIYDDLIQKQMMINHTEANFEFAPDATEICLEHPRLPFISYPWEWSFSMLKDAALLHLQIMEYLIPKGFWLRDASVFNTQYSDTGLLLIDTLSIGEKPPQSPWVAYSQFCSHFLAPLATAAYCDIRTMGLWRNYIDGFPLDLAVKMIPFYKKFSPRLFMHLTLHAQFQKKADQKKDLLLDKKHKKPSMNELSLIGIINSLKKCITNINWKKNSKIWASYDDIRTYDTDDIKEKADYIRTAIKKLSPSMVWDLGGNTGEFSLIAAEKGAWVISIDGDPACTELIYTKITKTQNGKRIIPLTMDLANPSGGLGWENKERLSLNQRGPADLLLALALIHHLVFSANIPLERIAGWFASLCENLVVEFMPPEDPMIKKLVQNRPEHLPYTLDIFKSGFGKYFEFCDQKILQNKRILFLCKKK